MDTGLAILEAAIDLPDCPLVWFVYAQLLDKSRRRSEADEAYGKARALYEQRLQQYPEDETSKQGLIQLREFTAGRSLE